MSIYCKYMEIDTEKFINNIYTRLDDLEDRITVLERPKFSANIIISTIGLLVAITGGIFTNIYVTVSRIDSLGIKYENMQQQIIELKQELRELRK